MHDDWQYAGDNRFLTFASLTPGNYEFIVKSCAEVEPCDEEAAYFAFDIKAPFWKTVYFQSFLIVLIAGVLILFHYLWSVRQVRKRQLLEHAVWENKISLDFTVKADAELLKIVIRNLLSNALKFTPSGGKVLIDAEAEGEHRVRVEFSDTGIGIPPDKADQVFTPDAAIQKTGTDGEKGTGLGLLLCSEFLEKLNGTIWVRESSSKGTTFSFTLPR